MTGDDVLWGRDGVMSHRLALEDIEPGHWVAWDLDQFGCFSSARTRAAALAEAPRAIRTHARWLAAHGGPAAPLERVQTRLVEEFASFLDDDDYRVNACFEDDRRPLMSADVERALWLLDCSRRDLRALLVRAAAEEVGAGGVRGEVRLLARHIAQAERWYFESLGLDQAALAADPLVALERVRAQTRRWLPDLVGDDRVIKRQGERWSARKVVRRTVWHERDHTGQIARLLAGPSRRGGGARPAGSGDS